MTSSERQIQERTEAFVAELTELLCQAAFEAVSTAIEHAAAAPPRSRPTTVSAVPKAPLSAPFSPKPATREKRSPEQLERLTGRLLEYITRNAGQRMEQVGAGMGIATKELQLPVRKLMEAGTIKTTGQRRSTQYFPRD